MIQNKKDWEPSGSPNNPDAAFHPQWPPQWGLRRQLVIGVTKYLMWGLPVLVGLDLLFGRNFVETLGPGVLAGIVGLPGGYLAGRSVQTAIRERHRRP
jgi:hypothetical protein